MEEVLLITSYGTYTGVVPSPDGKKALSKYLKEAKKVKTKTPFAEALYIAVDILYAKMCKRVVSKKQIDKMLNLVGYVLGTNKFKPISAQKSLYFLYKN